MNVNARYLKNKAKWELKYIEKQRMLKTDQKREKDFQGGYKMKKKLVSAILAATVVGSMIAAVPVAAESNDETLTVWCWDPNFNIYAMKQAEAEYQKDHPNFKLDIQENVYSDIETKLITAATS